MINEELLRAACKQIAEHPETWDQDGWGFTGEFNTAFCFAGHILLASGGFEFGDSGFHRTQGGRRISPVGVHEYAQQLLGITGEQANWLFYDPGNDGPAPFLRLVEEVTGIKVEGTEDGRDQ